MFERFSQEARTAVRLSADEPRRLRRDYIGPEHLLLSLIGRMIAKPLPAGLALRSPARGEHAQPLRRPLDLLAPADRQAEQKRGQRCRRSGHVVCHVARKVKDGLDIRLPAIKPEFRAGRLGPLIKGVHDPNPNGCHGERPCPARYSCVRHARARRRSAGESQSSHGGGSARPISTASSTGRIGANSPRSDRPW